MKVRVLPYKQGSKSAKALADELGGKVLKLQGSSYTPKQGDILIKWGNSSPDQYFNGWMDLFANGNTGLLKDVTNKLSFFKKNADEEYLPKFWTSKSEIPDDVYPVVCRCILTGHSGAGIVIANTKEELVDAPLYVQYKKKKDEYRVHCGKRPWTPHLDYAGEQMPEGVYRDDPHEIISIQRKARRLDCENPNWQVRNHANGFVFVRNNVNPPPCVTESAIKAFDRSGLDFGAVDVIYNEQENKAYVLEINTAPGLEGQTVKDYANFFKEF